MPLQSSWKLGASHSSKETPNDYPRIYLFGASIVERAFYEQDSGFGWMLQQYYDDRVEVMNEGYSGRTTRSLQEQFKTMLAAIEKRGGPPPLFITMLFGANDACLTLDGTLVPIAEFEKHVRHYVNSILEHPATKGTKVILISTPPVDVPPPAGDDSQLDDEPVATLMRSISIEGRGNRTWESKRLFAKKVVQSGAEFEARTDRVAVLDFWTVVTKFACQAEGKSNDEVFHELDLEEKLPGSGMPGSKEFGSSFFTDRLHFGKSAYEVLGRELLDLILNKWPELRNKNFPLRVHALPPFRFLLLTMTNRLLGLMG